MVTSKDSPRRSFSKKKSRHSKDLRRRPIPALPIVLSRRISRDKLNPKGKVKAQNPFKTPPSLAHFRPGRMPPKSSSSPPPSPERLAILKAREEIERNAQPDDHGRKPLIMDIILDSRPPVTEFREDILMEALERSQQALRPVAHRENSLEDGQSLDEWFANQGTTWKGLHGNFGPGLSTGSRISAERSTASWVSNL